MSHGYDHSCYCTDCCCHEERLTARIEKETRDKEPREVRGLKDVSWHQYELAMQVVPIGR